jgi:hypothetical protein
MTKWEYAVIPLVSASGVGHSKQKEELDKYGLEGWELVSMIELGLELIAYLKREKK